MQVLQPSPLLTPVHCLPGRGESPRKSFVNWEGLRRCSSRGAGALHPRSCRGPPGPQACGACCGQEAPRPVCGQCWTCSGDGEGTWLGSLGRCGRGGGDTVPGACAGRCFTGHRAGVGGPWDWGWEGAWCSLRACGPCLGCQCGRCGPQIPIPPSAFCSCPQGAHPPAGALPCPAFLSAPPVTTDLVPRRWGMLGLGCSLPCPGPTCWSSSSRKVGKIQTCGNLWVRVWGPCLYLGLGKCGHPRAVGSGGSAAGTAMVEGNRQPLCHISPPTPPPYPLAEAGVFMGFFSKPSEAEQAHSPDTQWAGEAARLGPGNRTPTPAAVTWDSDLLSLGHLVSSGLYLAGGRRQA
ncbi:uncharacterized protein LOC131817429 [Mustela lutreola]|uniref:uncharacterized protein LOC131817429 n=1 Tax=Mustela lutreola TaxID=9666 RepID=UPI002797B4C6|nr:uncharacterized protein LOC131817429 [Mustela lutreola]